jgi:RNA polymerase sigma factor FliA
MEAVPCRADARQKLVLKHYPMARAIACRIYQRLPKTVDLDDLISAGVEGLVEAVDRFDSNRSIPFEAYAKHRIHGAVVDSLRQTDWVPRSVRRKADMIGKARTELKENLGRNPTCREMAKALDMPVKKYEATLKDSEVRQLLSLDAPVGNENATPLIEQVAAGENLLEKWQGEELKLATLRAIQGLPDRERTAITLYYLHEMSLRKVGEVLGVTESRACQLCSTAVKRLKVRLRDVR